MIDQMCVSICTMYTEERILGVSGWLLELFIDTRVDFLTNSKIRIIYVYHSAEG